jgi:hypothetical protein
MRTVREVFALIGLVLFASAAPAGVPQAVGTAQAPHQHPASPQDTKPGMQGKMTTDCQSMMAQHQKMMEEMTAMDARLDTLVQTMNGATGPAKVDATAAVVAELVSQRKTMREQMRGMQGGMMQHMMEHMQAGGTQGMMECPMMKNMGATMKH